jgi:hypothetical protein
VEADFLGLRTKMAKIKARKKFSIKDTANDF